MDKVMAQLEGLVAHYEELQEMMADPEVINDTKRYMEVSKEEADLREVVQKYKRKSLIIRKLFLMKVILIWLKWLRKKTVNLKLKFLS